MTQGEAALHNLLNQYLHSKVQGHEVPIPYVRQNNRWRFDRSSGKGTPEVLRREIGKLIRRREIDLSQVSGYELYRLIRDERIGVDCSGLVYHLLDAYIRAELGKPLSHYLVRYPGWLGVVEKKLLAYQRYRRINARTLTSPLNCVDISRVGDVQVADMIQMSINKPADHVLLVVRVETDQHGKVELITYAHSSSRVTRKRGPHTAQIVVHDGQKGLAQQDWLEVDKYGVTYRDRLQPAQGDGIKRLKILAEL